MGQRFRGCLYNSGTVYAARKRRRRGVEGGAEKLDKLVGGA